MKIVAIILTFDEERHLGRCIASLEGVVDEVVVADCFSLDSTLEVARAHGARVIQREWINYGSQFNWALSQIDTHSDWVLRIDADEFLTRELRDEIRTRLPSVAPEVVGVLFDRRMTFQRKPIRYGGMFPVRVLRLFRYGCGQCENRWMDEHIKVEGKTVAFSGELIDDNLNTLTWWTNKHNKYASREAVDLLNLEYRFMPHDSVASLHRAGEAGIKRWVKEVVYARLPLGFRAFGYFLYRYVLRFGFLDGQVGAEFHFLQGFWYRYLVDAKVAEVKRHMSRTGAGPVASIRAVLDLDVEPGPRT